MKTRVLDISILAVKAVMDARGVVDQWSCLQKIISTFRMYDLPKMNSEES
jgi:hypothetical protein